MARNVKKRIVKGFVIFLACLACGCLCVGCGGGSSKSSSSGSNSSGGSSLPAYVKAAVLVEYNLSASDITKMTGRKTQDVPGMEGWQGTMTLKMNGATVNWAVNVDK